jgi:membrane-bound metal-dependent hydrolase YbcI (DUF457 family)
MDPVSHAVIGRALAAAVRPGEARGRGVAAAAILGSLSPDVDFVLMPVGWDVYLRAHVIGTHSVAGALVTGLGSAVLIRACVPLRGRRRFGETATGGRSAMGPLATAAILAALSHLLADIAAGARLRPAWPFSEAIVSAPLVAMGDPWTIAVLIVGAVLLWRWRATPARAARTALLTLCVFLGLKGLLYMQALSAVAADSRIDRSSRILEARWASLTEWSVFDRSPSSLRQWRVSVRSQPPLLVLAIDRHPESPLVERSRELQSVKNFLAVHELGFAREEPHGLERDVMWSDIRYCWREASATDVQCALWFGGVFDAGGRATMQEVRVGSWIQRRAP